MTLAGVAERVRSLGRWIIGRRTPRPLRRGNLLWRWAELLGPHPEGETTPVATDAIKLVPARRSKKKARNFRKGVNEVFETFIGLHSRRARRALAKMPAIDGTTSPKFLDLCEEHLGDLPAFPNPKVYDLASVNVDVCILGNVYPDDDLDEDADRALALPGTVGWYVGHFRSASMRTLRGRAISAPPPNLTARQRRRGYIPPARDPLFSALVIQTTYVCKYEGMSRASAFPAFCVSIDNGREWRLLTEDGIVVKDVELDRVTKAICAFEWGQRFHWTISIARPPSPPIQIFVDARNVLEFLWMRDREAGRRRRPAMIHLVRPHERQLPSGRTTTVRPHLRGSTTCDWKGWTATITPSEHDLTILADRMLPGQSMLEFIEANCDLLIAPDLIDGRPKHATA